ncbi:Ff.00g119450.m01.CDS01 [Fusarium sp. VM40]|nr:Ff.00g119450.m01.CDS01 [Fusarium sp. VM40]
MELAVLFITLFAMAFMIAANTPLETPRQAIGGAFIAGVLSLLGGAPFVAEILSSTVRNLWKEDIPLEDYMEHRPRVFHRSRAKFDTGDRFYHKYGVCCSERGNCVSCLKQQAEDARRFVWMGQDELDRRMKEELAK